MHPTRRTLYLTEWIDGSRIFEMNMDTLQLVRVFDTRDTGSFGGIVDEELDRIIVSGLWGINAIDLATGRTLVRRRLGPGVRSAVIDPHHDLVFMATTFGGHIWVLDRATLDVLGRVTTGLGGRQVYVTLDGRHLLASDQLRVYRFDVDAIARRLRGAPEG